MIDVLKIAAGVFVGMTVKALVMGAVDILRGKYFGTFRRMENRNMVEEWLDRSFMVW